MAVYPERRSSGLTGKWIAEVTQHGERRRKRFDSKLEADRWADFTKVTGSPPVATVIVEAVGRTYASVVAEAKLRNPSWTAGRDPSLGPRLEYTLTVFGKDTAIDAIKTADFDRLITKLKGHKGLQGRDRLTPATINRYLSVASAVLRYASKRGYIAAVPSVPWQVETGKRIHWLTNDAEAAASLAMLSEGKRDEELTMRVLAATGMRWGEFAGLTLGMVGDGWVRLDKTKTDTPRDIPLDVELQAELLDMLKRKAIPYYHQFHRVLKRAMKAAGQSEGFSIHCLRHTTATRLVHSGVNLAVVQTFMGHSSINTTLKYTHVSPQLLQDAMKKLSPHAGQSTDNAPQGVAGNPDETGTSEAQTDCVLANRKNVPIS